MKRVLPAPTLLGETIRSLYLPDTLKDDLPILCRLYLGKSPNLGVARVRRLRVVNTENFPLSAAQYEHVLSQMTPEHLALLELPSIDKIAAGMGEMLARFHIIGGCDARDVEFVMGGSDDGEAKFFVIDFNQASLAV